MKQTHKDHIRSIQKFLKYLSQMNLYCAYKAGYDWQERKSKRQSKSDQIIDLLRDINGNLNGRK